MPDRSCPRLRPVELLPFDADGEPAVLLRDPAGIADKPLTLAPAGAFLASRFDGRSTPADLQDALAKASGGVVLPIREIEKLIALLDERGFLEGAAFEARLAAALAAWNAAPARKPAHAGSVYPTEPEALRRELEGYYAKGPGEGPRAGADPDATLRAVFAPHIDLRAGGPLMAHAYRALVEKAPDADLFILLGTGHAPTENRVALTRKDYATPLGTLRTDVALVDRIAKALPQNAFASELNHRGEHSIEFQAVFLVHALVEALGEARLEKVRAVPILVGSFFDLLDDRGPVADAQVRALTGAVRSIIDAHPGRAVVVGGVDLAHLGRRFGGDDFTRAELPGLEQKDRAFLSAVVRGDARALHADVAADGDGRSYCGYPPLWVMAESLGPGRGEVLGWGSDLSDGAVVTFASGTLHMPEDG